MAEVKSIPGLRKSFASRTKELCDYFEHIPALLDSFPLDVCLAYAFSRLEVGQNMVLYCGLVKLHRTDAAVTRKVIQQYEKTHADFATKYQCVFSHKLPKRASDALGKARDARNKVVHGKKTTHKELRQAIASVLDFAQSVNAHVDGLAGFKPYGDLRGFKGGKQALDKATTRWILRGIGFNA